MSGKHYKINGEDLITAMENGLVSREQYIGFLKGNVMKYVVRCEYKGDVLSDLDKAKDYLEILYDFFKLEKTDDLEKKKLIHDIATKLRE